VRLLAEGTADAENAVRHRSDTAPSPLPAQALATMVTFLSYSGLRFGECAALRVADIDTAKRRVMVGKSTTQVCGQGRLEGGTKTDQRRVVTEVP
jgi:integrase